MGKWGHVEAVVFGRSLAIDAYGTLLLSQILSIINDTLWHVAIYDALGFSPFSLYVRSTIVLRTKSRPLPFLS